MVYSTRSKKSLWNCSSTNGFMLVVTLMFVCISSVNLFEHDNDDTINCSKFHTCTKCAEKTSCSWSLKQQSCMNTTRRPEHFIVNIRAHCPQFSIVNSFIHAYLQPLKYKLKVSNDVSGFVKHLYSSNITCLMKGKLFSGTVDVETDEITCALYNSDIEDSKRLTINHFSIMFNDVTLRIDDGVNNYLTVYNHYRCTDVYVNHTKDCVSCFWESEHYTFYYKRCSASNACTGLFELYDRVNLNIDVGPSDERTSSMDNGETEDDWTSGSGNVTTTFKGFGPPANACPDMRIHLVEPLSAPWSGGTTLVITIRNHKVLAESRMVTVLVAGRDCVYPKTLNDDSIECTVGPPTPNDLTMGPVHVMYGSMLLITSVQTFQFIYPEPTAVSPKCGPVTGGTLLRITGRSLEASSTVTVTVGPANVTCELVARYENRILCVTGPSNVPIAGDVTVEFDKFLRRTVGLASTPTVPSFEPVQFVYAGDPVLDARQQFEGIASGGTYIPVRGRHFACFKNASMYVDDLDGMRHNTNCEVHNDTFMVCQSPALVVPQTSFETVSLNFGFRVHFADHMLDLAPQPEYPSYHLYTDPVFTDFETKGRKVIINGRQMNRGYEPSADLVIRLRNAIGDLCVITDMQGRRIVCERPVPAAGIEDNLLELYVTVGHKFIHIVKKNIYHIDCSWGVLNVFLLIVCAVTVVCIM